jgi:hypothetical protein
VLVDKLVACIEACKECDKACGDHPQNLNCRQACLDCIQWCRRLLTERRPKSPWPEDVAMACAFACDTCGEFCELDMGKSFQQCVEACLDCAAACTMMVARQGPVSAVLCRRGLFSCHSDPTAPAAI